MQLTQFSVVGLVLFTMTWRGGSVIVISSPEDLSFVNDLTIKDFRVPIVFTQVGFTSRNMGYMPKLSYLSLLPCRNVTKVASSLLLKNAYILTSCHGDRIRGVGLAGNLPGALIRILSTQHSIPVTLIDNTPSYSETTPFQWLQFRQQLPVFIVEASSPKELSYTIERNIRGTIWWNHMASFFILDRSPKCINVINFLYIAWIHDILNAKVICDRLFMGRRLIYNSNPYTIQAPAPWKTLNVFRTTNNHRFAVFIRVYTKNEAICLNLDFDKTKNLEGYEISVEGLPLSANNFIHSEATLNEYQYWSTRDRVFHNIFCSLHATPTFTPLKRVEDPIHTDIRKVGRLMLYVWATNKITYPHAHTGFVLISQFRGHKSQLEKILCVIDFNSRLGMGIVYFVTLIFLKFFVCQALVPALLNLVRITCNTGFTNLPDENAHRIFLGCLLFLVVTIQGIYQGNLATLLTTNIPLRNINVMMDVVDLDYKLYGNDFMAKFVKQYPQLDGRFTRVSRNSDYCLEHVMNDSSAACLWIAQGPTLDRVRELELHTSGEFVATFYSGFEIRWDWPLEQRVNIILSRMVEADVIPPWDVKCKPLKLTDFKYDKEVLSNKDFKNIELAELTFAFVILYIGLVFATIIFVVEVAISPT